MNEDLLMYDWDDAVLIIATETKLPAGVIGRVLHARDALLNVMGVMPDDPEVDAAVLRGKYHDLLHGLEKDVVEWPCEATFCQLETGLSITIVVRVLAADLAYMQRQGIVDPGAVDDYRDWASEWTGGTTQ